MEIKSVKYDTKKNLHELSWSTPCRTDVDRVDEQAIKSHDTARQEFYDAMQDMKHIFVAILDYSQHQAENMIVSSVSFKDGDKPGVEVKAEYRPKLVREGVPVKTTALPLALFSQKELLLISSLQLEAIEYIHGNRAQQVLKFDEKAFDEAEKAGAAL